MKVGLVIPQFDPRLGGAEQWTWQFAHRLAARGHEVHIVAERFSNQAAAGPLLLHQVQSGGGKLRFAEAAAATLRHLALDLVHDMGIGWQCDVFQPHGGSRRAAFEQNLLLCPRSMRPIKRQLAGVLPRYREFERLLAKQYVADGRVLLAISQMVARDFQRFHGASPEQIRVVYNGVDCERFSPRHRGSWREPLRAQLGLCDDDVLLLIVAHNFALKGVPTLLRAAAQLQAEGAPVHVAVIGGKKPARTPTIVHSALRIPRSALRTSHSPAHFLGPIADPSGWYAAADVYVQPTYYDPCSLVVLEALASGLPVITSRFNGAGELLTPGEEGWVMHDPANADELAALLRPLLNRTTRERMGEAARRLALSHTLERNCDEIVALYQNHLAASRRAA